MIRFDPASFKDPAGRVFYADDHLDWIGRTLTPEAQAHLEAASRAGLLSALVADGFLVESELVRSRDLGLADPAIGSQVLKQRKIAFVSYPYEWSFEMLRDAALATLAIMDRALGAGFVLKDATGFNILFDGVTPKLVDVPSIEPYVEGRVWAGYGQFCRSFLFPLLLSAYRDVDVQALLRGTLGEVPVAFAANLFGLRDYSRPGVLKDVMLQARLERTFGRSTQTVQHETSARAYPKALLVANVRRLRTLVEGLKGSGSPSEWSAYEVDCTYSDTDRAAKHAFVTRAIGDRRLARVVDLGCNTGAYSRLALTCASQVVALDLDSKAIDRLYRQAPRGARLSPVVANLLNPTPAMGWALQERRSLFERLSSNAFLALALIHHLRITGGVPLAAIVTQLLAIAPEGIVEWVDKEDPQVQAMLALRPDVYDDYAWPTFEALIAERGEVVAVHDTHAGRRRLCHVRARPTHPPRVDHTEAR
jgi:SAM-dependent methyltransferase